MNQAINTFKSTPAPVIRRENTRRIESSVSLTVIQRIGRFLGAYHHDMTTQARVEAYDFVGRLALAVVLIVFTLIIALA